MATPALAQPAGGNIVSGQATITQPSVYSTLITQSSAKAIIDWQNFSVANGQSVQFAQPNASSVTLNRVTGGTLSSIQGSITANGQVWLINPNGVMFGRNANINVGGLLATTSDIANGDFLSGNYVFNNAPSGSAVVNHGTINASTGGSVVLSAQRVSNRGVITARAGHVVLGSAEAFTVDFNGDKLLSYAVKTPAGSDASKASGTVAMTPRAAAQVQRDVVNDFGMAEATHARVESGEVILDGDAPAGATNSGKIDVSGKAPGQVGGTAELLGKTVSVTDGAKIDASGDAGGGTVLIGGALHGAGPQPNAKTVTVGKATISADAATTGNGGTVAIYSTGKTKVAAAISAQGGAAGGDGGQVETSGEALQIDDATTVNTAAIRGTAGDWLLDPGTINIATGGAQALGSDNGFTFADDANTTDTVTIAPNTITTALGSGNVTLQATTAINVNNALSYTSANELILESKGSINLNASIQNAGSGSIALTAGWDGNTAVTGVAASGSYGVNGSSGGITLAGNVAAVGGAGGTTYINAYSLSLTGASGPTGNSYQQVGYHGADGGDINIQTLRGGVGVSNLAAGSTVQIGNGGYDGNISGAATGNIAITTTGATSVSTSGGTASIGNYAGTHGESGNVTLTTGTLTSSGTAYDVNTLINNNIGTTGAGAGGDVSLTLTNASAATTINALSYNSPHLASVTTNNTLTFAGAINNAGTGNLSFFSQSGSLTDIYAIHTNGDLSITSFADVTLGGALTIGGETNIDAAGVVTTTNTGNSLTGPIYVTTSGGSGITPQINIVNSGNLLINRASVSQSNGSAGAINISTLSGDITVAGAISGQRVTISSAGNIVEGSQFQGQLNIPIPGSISATDLDLLTPNGSIGTQLNPVSVLAGNVYVTGTDAFLSTASSQGVYGNLSLGNSFHPKAVELTGTLGVLANGVTQTAPISASTVSITSLGMNPITLTDSGNQITGTVDAQAQGGSFGSQTDQIAITNYGTLKLGVVVAGDDGSGNHGSMDITALNGGDIQINDRLEGGLITLNASSTANSGIIESGAGAIISHRTGDNTGGGGVALNAGGAITLNGANVIETAAGNGELAEGELVFIAGGNADIHLSNNNLALFGASSSNGYVSIVLDVTNGGTNPNLDIYNSISATQRITLDVAGDISQQHRSPTDPNILQDPSIGTPIGLSATSHYGNLNLGDGGTSDGFAGAGNKIGGDINAYTVLNAPGGNATFTNTMDTILGGPAFFAATTADGAPRFAYNSGTPTPQPQNYTSPDSTVYGNLTVNVTDANEASGHAVLMIAGRIHAQNRNGGNVSLTASGDIDNNSGDGTIIAGYGGANNNLVLSSINGGIGASDGTNWSFGDGADSGTLNLQALAPNGSIVINPGDINFGITGNVGPAIQAGNTLTVYGNGVVTQNSDLSGVILASDVGISGIGNITLNNPYNAVTHTAGFQTPNDIVFANSTAITVNNASAGLNSSNTINPAASLTVTVRDPSGATAPVLHIGQTADYYTDANNMVQAVANSINVTGSVTLSADGGIVDDYAPTNTNAGWILTQGTVSLNSTNSAISLTNPLNVFGALNANSHGGNITIFTSAPTFGQTPPNARLLIGTNGINAGGGALNLTIKDASFIQDSDSGAITAASLIVTASGSGHTIDLRGSENKIDGSVSLSADSDVYFINGADTFLDSNTSISGLLDLESTGNLTINSGAVLTAGQAGDGAVVLSAANAFINNAGSGAINFTNGGAFQIYSDNPHDQAENFGGLDSGNTAVWRTFFGDGISVEGNRYVFRYAPTLTITSTDVSKNQGQDATAAVAVAYTVSGLEPGVAGAYLGDNLSGTPSVTSAGSGTSAETGTYSITAAQGGLNLQGYNFDSESTGVLTVNTANTMPTLYYVADPFNRSYGSANPIFTGTVTGFQSGDTLSSSTTGTAVWTTNATQYTNVGQYQILGSGLSSRTYQFAQSQGNYTALTINAALLSYVSDSISKTYGDANPALGGTTTGYLGNDTQANATTGTYLLTTTATTGSDVGSYAINGSGLSATNYTFVQAASNATALTINPATLIYVAAAASKTYGNTNPAFIGTVTGFVNGDTMQSATTGSTAWTIGFNTNQPPTDASQAATNVGQYAIVGSGLSAKNYTFQQAASNSTAFTINSATLTYVATAATKTYGDANPAFGGTVTGFVNGDTQSTATSGTLAFNSSATAGSGVGSYAIVGLGLSARNYAFVQAGGNNVALVINPATLTYVANTTSRTYGAANPVFGGTVTGFVNGDTQQSATTGTLIFASPATAGAGLGSYAINGSGLSANNYVFVQKAGNAAAFTINPATLTATLTGTVVKTYDGNTQATLSSSNYAPLIGVVGTDKVVLAIYPTSGSYSSATAGTGKTVTVTGLSLSGAAAGNYVLASSIISAPIGVIEQKVLTSNPGLLSVVTGNPQTFAILQTAITTTPFVAPSSPTGPTLAQTQTVELAALANPNPIAALASPDPSDTAPPELPTSIEIATTFIVDSMDGKATSSAQGNDIIPGILTMAPGQTPASPGTGDNLSAWGNPSLWQ